MAVHPGTVDYADASAASGTWSSSTTAATTSRFTAIWPRLTSARGDRVEAGTELGRVGAGAGRPAALYFELRVDGRSVDPVQWLKPVTSNSQPQGPIPKMLDWLGIWALGFGNRDFQ